VSIHRSKGNGWSESSPTSRRPSQGAPYGVGLHPGDDSPVGHPAHGILAAETGRQSSNSPLDIMIIGIIKAHPYIPLWHIMLLGHKTHLISDLFIFLPSFR